MRATAQVFGTLSMECTACLFVFKFHAFFFVARCDRQAVL